jgi:phosphatidate cytidylyltransferase
MGEGMSQLKWRILTAGWAIPLTLITVYLGGWYFAILLTLACIFSQAELYRLGKVGGGIAIMSIGFGALLPLLMMLHQDWILIYILVTGLLVVILSPFQGTERLPQRVGITICGLIYPSLFLSSYIPIRVNADGGMLIIIFILSTIWVCDTCAYAGGKLMGKHKLAPVVSPNKTWEGFVFGLLSALIWAGLSWLILKGKLNLMEYLGGGLMVGIVGQVGDLAESAWKRSAGVKDSGRLFGAHGGALDRLDSIIAVGPVFYLYLIILGVM